MTPEGVGESWSGTTRNSLERMTRRRQIKRRQSGGQRAAIPFSRRQRFLIGLESALSLCGLAGGLMLMTRPLTAMSLKYLNGTWFDTWRWPGVALFSLWGSVRSLLLSQHSSGGPLPPSAISPSEQDLSRGSCWKRHGSSSRRDSKSPWLSLDSSS